MALCAGHGRTSIRADIFDVKAQPSIMEELVQELVRRDYVDQQASRLAT